MIYTVTLNPSLDYVADVKGYQPGEVSRTARERIFPGGKGLNVSLMLKNLEMDSVALSFSAGFTGAELERLLRRHGCIVDFIMVEDGFTRINVKLHSDGISEINGAGPQVGPLELEKLCQKLTCLSSDDVLVLAGSIPRGAPVDVYAQILERVRGVRVVLDTSGEPLRLALSHSPFLVKPNLSELKELLGREVLPQEAFEGAYAVQKMGARNVLVSMGEAGAVLVTEDGLCLQSGAPRIQSKNAVGAGDSMVAGFLAGLSGGWRKAMALGVCAGSATASQEWLADCKTVASFYDDVFGAIKEVSLL